MKSKVRKSYLLFTSFPGYLQMIIIATTIASIGGKGLLGFRVSGLTWFVPLVFSIFYLIPRIKSVSFPWKIWSIWVVLLVLSLFYTKYSALQRTAQLLSPIVIGMCVSTLHVRDDLLSDFIRFCRVFTIVLIVIWLGKTGLLTTGILPQTTGLAAELMTGLLLASIFAATYSYGIKKDLLLWILLCVMPVYGVYRSGMAVMGLTLPFTFAPLLIIKRIFFILLAIPIALAIFYSPRIQQETFYSKRGAIEDVFTKDFNTSGRKAIWETVKKGFDYRPWLGHGTGACETLVLRVTGGLRYPHNDWYLTRYDHGRVGVTIYALTLLAAMLHALRSAKKARGTPAKVLFQTGSFSFVILALMMITDNIMVYASFFGNLQFAILGLAYTASDKRRRILKKATGK